MTRKELVERKKLSLVRILMIEKDVHEGRWDNTNMRSHLETAVAAHEAACRELYVMSRLKLATFNHDPLEEACVHLAQAAINYPTKRQHILDLIEMVKKLFPKGGDS